MCIFLVNVFYRLRVSVVQKTTSILGPMMGKHLCSKLLNIIYTHTHARTHTAHSHNTYIHAHAHNTHVGYSNLSEDSDEF